jgi:putative mRNA 3-end processing factor
MQLLQFTESGIYCKHGKFYIDPWKRVDCALITHAHSDHSRWGMKHYIAHHLSVNVMKLRLGKDISINGYEYGEFFYLNGVKISFHPAGHIIGSAQIRVEYKGEVWVVSGDYKVENDLISTAFEPVKCHTFITESTFGLPIYKWKPQNLIFNEVNDWWATNAKESNCSVILGYSLGKAQRILQNVDDGIGNIYTHTSIENTNEAIRNSGIKLKETNKISTETPRVELGKGLVIAPPSAMNTPWIKKLEPYSLAVASGWMATRGGRRRRNIEKGFVISDHADWNGLLKAISATECEKIFVTHGFQAVFVKYLQEQGLDSEEVVTQFAGEELEEENKEISI